MKPSLGLSCWIGACGLAWRVHFNLLSSLFTTGLLVPLSAVRAECERTAIAYLAAVKLATQSLSWRRHLLTGCAARFAMAP